MSGTATARVIPIERAAGRGRQPAEIERAAGRGRQPAEVEALRDLREELTARRTEALALVGYLMPMMSVLIGAGREAGPREYQVALTVRDRLLRYARQQDPGIDDPATAA